MAGAIKVFEGQAVDLGGDIPAETVGNVHGDIGHDPALDVAEDGGSQVQPQGGQNDPPDVVEIDAGTGAGDHAQHALKEPGGSLAQDLGPEDHEDRGTDRKQHGDQNRKAIRSQVLDQTAHGALEITGLFAFHHGHRAVPPAHRSASRLLAILGTHVTHHDSSS